uniref:Uncharacterized protein n=1 Tax=viral metagenome TaxID=1070528 RepID=A0A6M3LR26_9ZZZZ
MMHDTVGRRPPLETKGDVFKLIEKLARDKRGHVLMTDHCEWLELRLREIAKLARLGRRKGEA